MSYTLKVTRTETWERQAPDTAPGTMQYHIRERARRLRDAKIPHTISGNMITYTVPASGDQVRLEYVEDE